MPGGSLLAATRIVILSFYAPTNQTEGERRGPTTTLLLKIIITHIIYLGYVENTIMCHNNTLFHS